MQSAAAFISLIVMSSKLSINLPSRWPRLVCRSCSVAHFPSAKACAEMSSLEAVCRFLLENLDLMASNSSGSFSALAFASILAWFVYGSTRSWTLFSTSFARRVASFKPASKPHREINGSRRARDSLNPFSELLMRVLDKEGDASTHANWRGGKKRELTCCCMLVNWTQQPREGEHTNFPTQSGGCSSEIWKWSFRRVI